MRDRNDRIFANCLALVIVQRTPAGKSFKLGQHLRQHGCILCCGWVSARKYSRVYNTGGNNGKMIRQIFTFNQKRRHTPAIVAVCLLIGRVGIQRTFRDYVTLGLQFLNLEKSIEEEDGKKKWENNKRSRKNNKLL
jgi:hypothetical protein